MNFRVCINALLSDGDFFPCAGRALPDEEIAGNVRLELNLIIVICGAVLVYHSVGHGRAAPFGGVVCCAAL